MIPFPDKKYSIIYADPPWSYQNRGTRAAASKHYDTMTIEDIKHMGVGAAGGGIANEDCVLFMWATFPMLREALDVIEAWGFSYKTVAFNWVKQNRNGTGIFMGLGNWTRSNSEICLLATKGKPKRISGSVRSIVLSPLQQHSRKPAEIRDSHGRVYCGRPEGHAREVRNGRRQRERSNHMNEQNQRDSIMSMARGAFEERVDYEMDKVIQNILDPNTKATAKRKITLTIELTPDDERRTIGVSVTAKSTLAATNPVATALYVTSDGNGELVVAEMVPQVPGQMNMDGTQQEAPKLLKLVQHG